MKLQDITEVCLANQKKHYATRAPLPGYCIDIDHASWHKDGQICSDCGFGIDDFGDGRGFWSEPLVTAVHACGDHDCIVPHPAPHKRPPA